MAPRSDHTLQADPALLLSHMDEEMALRGFARATKRLYLAHARRFLEGRTGEPGPDQEVRQWLLSLIEAWRSHSNVGQALSAVRFLYVYVLSFYDKAKRDRRFRAALKALQSKVRDGKVVVESPHRQLAGLSFCKKSEPSQPATKRYREILKNLDA